MKTKEELNALKEDVEALNEKLAELSEEELKEVTGGFIGFNPRGFASTDFPSPVIAKTDSAIVSKDRPASMGDVK